MRQQNPIEKPTSHETTQKPKTSLGGIFVGALR